MSGYLLYRNLKILSPSFPTLYAAQRVYIRNLESAKKQGIMTEEESFEKLMTIGRWDDELEYELNQIPKDLDKNKKKLFLERTKPQAVVLCRKFIKNLRSRYEILFNQKYMLRNLTCEGIAANAKSLYLIEKLTRLAGKSYNFSKITREQVLLFQIQNTISESQYRELARTEPFQSLWFCKKSIRFFKGTNEQIQLVRCATFYNNIRSHQNYPGDSILDDDDMLDGWLLVEKDKEEKERKKVVLDTRLGGVKGNEVFVMAQNQEEANEIYDLNDDKSKVLMAAKAKRVAALGGNVNEKQLQTINELQR